MTGDNKNIKILVVEDDKINSLVLNKFLDKKYDLANAYDGYEALDKAKKFIPEIVLMDISLGDPDMDGINAMYKINEMIPKKDIKFIAVTSFAMQGDKQALLNKGFHDYLSKPVYKEQLISSIEKQIQRLQS